MNRRGPGVWRRLVVAALLVGLVVAADGCTGRPSRPAAPRITPDRPVIDWVYQLQGYPGGRLDAVARATQSLAVIDLARDAHADYFTRPEIEAVRSSGKVVLAYFEIGSIEQFRPEYPETRRQGDLILNRWPDWPDEFFVRYWDQRWWDLAVRPRIDQALRAGFDGIYLDTPLAYEELDLALTPGRTRADLARAMVDLIVRISRYAKSQRPGLLVFPQNSPELREYDGYTGAIDGIGMEDLFYRSPDEPCTESWCEENLGNARALRDAGKVVLAVDYAGRAEDVRAACARYRQEGFGGYVTSRALDRVSPPCR
ncbi:hypothetical protein GCM10010169_01320 [Micromonospora fulviviridis]|uniref:endo alpha-1,4 polygalactosaminidase n=1 Tax=Micromonospora fulviviridis TaxID=47860 RepID=UPI0019A7A2FE|nr:endo alpha-1,4 polygalactosaminidase [Micromonospora fulviviridis]GGR62590.1 hypothetical protein GCM10010169_01320 [Micromonospora fulviviridis]